MAADLDPQDEPSPQEVNEFAALYNAGRTAEAAAFAQAMTEHYPDHAGTFSNLGAILHRLGRLDEAETAYRRALAIQPDFPAALFNLSNTLRDLGRLDDAVAGYLRVLEITPDSLETLSNLGNALKDLGRLDAAEIAYRQALQHQPDATVVLNNLALLLVAQGQCGEALDVVLRSLRIQETDAAKRAFIACVRRLRWTQDNGEIRRTMVRALTEPWGRPADLAAAGTTLLKLTLPIGAAIERTSLATLAADPLLIALLTSAPVGDIAMEHFLTMARRALLDAAGRGDESGSRFFCALAQQCFINEYVFADTDDERETVRALRDKLSAALATDADVPVLWPVAVAAYGPLAALPEALRLLARRWPDDVMAVLVQQVREPAEEQRERAGLRRLTTIDDDISRQVQAQYEEHPYPRWIRAAPPEPVATVAEFLIRKFPLAPVRRDALTGPAEILIAGCGTGQHPIGTAQRFPSARVLAVDLSLSSLAYARRKTRELGLTTIEYAHADLLKLGAVDLHFDVIESVGVLHHLADPWAGWQVLLSRLRAGGVMRLGFYSETARRQITAAREFISARNYGSTSAEIRRCRQELMALDDNAGMGPITGLADFFTVSTCRDLLFHVQEHRMTLPGIAGFLRANDLTFLGFEIDPDVLQAYLQRFPDDPAACDLAQWHVFESENPDTFVGMYQFWVQR